MTPPRSPQVPLEPYHFCTYFDRNYLTRGLALYQSLREHCRRPFILWTLCLDDESHAILTRLGLEGMRLIHRDDFEAGDAELAAARSNRNAVEYYWTCTPSLPLYVLRQDETIALITYLDADLFFYSDPQPIFDEFGAGSILIHGHRYAPEHAHFANTSGIYNVGLLSFRRDAAGMECLHWWRDRCNEWCYARFEDGKYGDQKYLDDWPERFSGVVVLQHPGAGVAPWNVTATKIEVKVRGPIANGLPIVFYHFSWELNAIEPSHLIPLYYPYVEELRRCATKALLPTGEAFAHPIAHAEARAQMPISYRFTAGPKFLNVLIWRWTARTMRGRACLQAASGKLEVMDKIGARQKVKQAFKFGPQLIFERYFLYLAVSTFLGDSYIEYYRKWRHFMGRRQ